MNNTPEWEPFSRQLFKPVEAKAPPFLWTRVLSAIEELERKRASMWWLQWRWMGRVATAMAVLVSLGAGMVFYENAQGTSLEQLLNGVTTPQQAQLLLSARPGDAEETVALIAEGGATWQAN